MKLKIFGLEFNVITSDIIQNNSLYLIPPIPKEFVKLKNETESEYRFRYMKEFPEYYGKIERIKKSNN